VAYQLLRIIKIIAMAELHVQRKRSSFMWLWIFLILVAAAAGLYLYMHYKDPKGYPLPDKSAHVQKKPATNAVKVIPV
jgi:hypothetical protein